MTRDEIVRRITEALTPANEEKPRLRLSQLHMCPRYQYFQLHEPPQPVSTAVAGHFLKGVLFEKWVASLWPQAETQKEVEFFGVKGHIDLFVPPDTVLEVKTTTENSLAFVPSFHHVWQVKAYMAALKENGVDEPKGFLIYIPADNPAACLHHIYEVTLSENDSQILKEAAILLTLCADLRTPPDIPKYYNKEALPCAGVMFGRPYQCPFYERCWGEQESTAIVPKSWVDAIGASMQEYTVELARYDPTVKLWRQVEEKIKNYLRERDDIVSLQIEGQQFRIVARKAQKPREYVDVKALRADLGDDFLRPYLKSTPVIYVSIEPIQKTK